MRPFAVWTAKGIGVAALTSMGLACESQSSGNQASDEADHCEPHLASDKTDHRCDQTAEAEKHLITGLRLAQREQYGGRLVTEPAVETHRERKLPIVVPDGF